MATQEHLRGKVAIVTGASRGAGRIIALYLAREGVDVVLAARTAKTLQAVGTEIESLRGGRALPVPTDLTNEADVAQLFARAEQHFGGVDILVNNAGLTHSGPVETMSQAEWDEILHVNLRGVFFCCREAIGAMRRRGGGNIISIGSGAGKQGYPNLAAYSASKFALLGFSQALAAEVSSENIKVSLVNPGSIAGTGKHKPGRKVINPEDLAQAVIYLLKQPSSAWTAEMNLWPFIYTEE